MKTKFTVDFFINKFSAIPEEKWCTGVQTSRDNKHCALGHCLPQSVKNLMYSDYDAVDSDDTINAAYTQEGKALINIFLTGGELTRINNGYDLRYWQPTPKQRILSALYDIKKKQQPKEEVKPEPQYRFIKKHKSVEKLLETKLQLS